MLEAGEDVFYYLTVMNENYVHPAMPAGAEEGILRGMYRLQTRDKAQIQLLGSGTILREVIAAGALLETDWGVAANVWSVTSFSELARDGMEAERWNRLHPLAPKRQGWAEACLGNAQGPALAASDYVRAVPELIRAQMPRRYVTLGTDGFGRSDTRAALRDFFEVEPRAYRHRGAGRAGRRRHHRTQQSRRGDRTLRHRRRASGCLAALAAARRAG